MPTDFAALEQKVNASVFRHMPNAEAVFTPDGGDPLPAVDVVFDSAQAVEDETTGVITHRPTLVVNPDDAAGIVPGHAVAITATWGTGNYKVRQVLPLAEGGMQRLVLARV